MYDHKVEYECYGYSGNNNDNNRVNELIKVLIKWQETSALTEVFGEEPSQSLLFLADMRVNTVSSYEDQVIIPDETDSQTEGGFELPPFPRNWNDR